MKHILLFILVLCSAQNLLAQDKVFETKVSKIAFRIDSITTSEKALLKKELKKIDKQLQRNEINAEEAEATKNEIANQFATKINEAVAIEEQKLQKLIQNRVNGELETVDDDKRSLFFNEENFYKDSTTGMRLEKRLTTQFVFALGMNTVLNDNDAFYGDGFKLNPIGYSEAGFTFKYRLKEQTNLWNLKAGLSLMGTDFHTKNDDDILVTSGNQTIIEDAGFDIKRSRFNSLYIGLPVHLELDFSKPKYNNKTQQTYLRSQRGFRMGLGGFIAVRLYTSQFIRYDSDGKRNRLEQQDDFNMNNFSFGPSAYVGYRDLSVFVRYEANPIFKNNPVDINGLSFGLRLDLN